MTTNERWHRDVHGYIEVNGGAIGGLNTIAADHVAPRSDDVISCKVQRVEMIFCV